MKLVFAGTPAVAVPTLRALVEAGHDIALVVTREDAPRGRKRVLTPSEVADAAVELGLPLLKTNRVDADVVEQIRATGADLGVVVAYGALLKPSALAALPLGWINLHFSLLPSWRGAAPVQHNLIAGGPTGVTVFQLDEGVDTGSVWAVKPIDCAADDTSGEVLEQFARLGAPVVVDAIAQIAAGKHPTPQEGPSTHASKLQSSDGELHPSHGIASVYALFRGVTPEPGAFVMIGDERIKVLEARRSVEQLAIGELSATGGGALLGTGDGALLMVRVQPAGKSAMSASDWLRGKR